MTTKVGFIGLGRIGQPMAANIARAGFDLMVYDIRPEPMNELAQLGARVGRSPKDVGSYAEVIELALVDDHQVEEVVLGAEGVLATARAGSIIAIHSTISPKTILKLAKPANESGVHILDVQISGGEQGARDKQLCYMVGGDNDALEHCRPLFSTSAANIFHVGKLASGANAKMILQVVVCINMLAAAEAERLSEKADLDFSALREILRVSSGQSFVLDHWLERFKRADDPMPVRENRTEVFRKSLLPALELARDLGVAIPGTALAWEQLPLIMGIRR